MRAARPVAKAMRPSQGIAGLRCAVCGREMQNRFLSSRPKLEHVFLLLARLAGSRLDKIDGLEVSSVRRPTEGTDWAAAAFEIDASRSTVSWCLAVAFGSARGSIRSERGCIW